MRIRHCRRCWDTGHDARNCPNEARPRPADLCHNCGCRPRAEGRSRCAPCLVTARSRPTCKACGGRHQTTACREITDPGPVYTGEYPDERPQTRGRCLEMPRPCPFVSCSYHLAPDLLRHVLRDRTWRDGWRPMAAAEVVSEEEAAEAVVAMPASCLLDLADRDGMTLEQVGLVLEVTRERARQIEAAALRKERVRRLLILNEMDTEE